MKFGKKLLYKMHRRGGLCSLGTYSSSGVQKVIMGLIFLRYISVAFDKRYQELPQRW